MGRMFTILAAGGSLSGNVGATPRIVPSLYAAQFDGARVRPLRDPLFGSAGGGGGVWTRVAPLLLDSGVFTKFVMAPMSSGEGDVTMFRNGEKRLAGLRARVAQLRESSLSPDIAVFALGPADTDVPRAQAVQAIDDVRAMLRAQDVAAPLVLTGLGAPSDAAPRVDALRDGLAAELGDGVAPGPDADGADVETNDKGLPTDGGLETMAEAWRAWIEGFIAASPAELAAAE